MKKVLALAALIIMLASGESLADSELPFQDFNLGPHYQTVKSTAHGASGAGSMYGLEIAFNGSLIDALLDGSNHSLRYGDYLGGYTLLSSASYDKSHSIPYFIGLGFSYGVQAGFSFTDNIEIGARYYVDIRDNIFGPTNNSTTLHMNTGMIMGRVGSIYLDMGTGSGRNANNSERYDSTIVHARYLVDDGGYVGIMMDSSKVTYTLSNREDKIVNFVVQFGIMK